MPAPALMGGAVGCNGVWVVAGGAYGPAGGGAYGLAGGGTAGCGGNRGGRSIANCAPCSLLVNPCFSSFDFFVFPVTDRNP